MKQSKRFWRALLFFVLLAALCGSFAFPVVGVPVSAAPRMQVVEHLVISQVFGGGGNANAPFTNDFIELFNPTNAAIPVDGWSIQYAGNSA